MNSTLKILCLEDDEEDFEIINHILEESSLSVVTMRVDTREKYLNALSLYNPDVILSDHALPTFNSTEALSLCQERHLQVPFILVTGAVSDEFAVSCIKLGADDYILKSNLSRLASAIENAVKHKETERAKVMSISELASQNTKLVKINKEVDSFVYSVSHNLRAPLMSVLGLVNLAKQENNLDVLHRYHQMMADSINRLDDTIKEILDYSRNSRQETTTEKIDLKKLIQGTLQRMKFMPGFASLDIRVSVNDQIPFYSDHYRLSVIMNNLISNGIKYANPKKQKPSLDISAVIDEKKAVFKFGDNGIGIENYLVPKIFNMFFRANSTKEGSGLGLYIVQEAIEKLQGKIEVESIVGEGTLFKFEIPNLIQIKKITGMSVSQPPAMEHVLRNESDVFNAVAQAMDK